MNNYFTSTYLSLESKNRLLFNWEVKADFWTWVASKDLYDKRCAPTLMVSENVGNMYTPSLYGCLLSLLERIKFLIMVKIPRYERNKW